MRYRANGGLIGPKDTINAEDTTGMWSMVEQQIYKGANSWPSDQTSSLGADPYFKYVVFQTAADGTNGANNSVFVNSGVDAATISKVATPGQGNFSPYSPNGWSVYFNSGASDHLTYTGTTVGTQAYTLECWFNGPLTSQTFIFGTSASTANAFGVGISGSHVFVSCFGATPAGQLFPATPIANQWNHVAITRDSSLNTTVFLNGTRSSAGSVNMNINYNGLSNQIGDNGSFSQWIGYLSNVRLVTGTNVYTPTDSTITVPVSSLTNIASTQILTCQDNRFKDNSTNGYTLTVNDRPIVQPFSPFAAGVVYDPLIHGGSVYFNNNLTEFLNTNTSSTLAPGTGDFTFEYWFYPQKTSRNDNFYLHSASPNQRLEIFWDGSSWIYGETSVTRISVSTASLRYRYQWYHVSLVRSGSTVTLYLNGNSVGTYTTAIDWNSSTFYIQIGKDTGGATYMGGYMSDVIYLKGIAARTGNFTPPTSPYVANSVTSFLLSATNAAVFDATGRNNVTAKAGSPTLSTSVKKYGSASLNLTSAHVDIKHSENLNPLFIWGTKDFTIEMWVYLTAAANEQVMYDQRNAISDVAPVITISTSRILKYYTASTERITGTTTLSLSTWHHVAVCRSSGSTKLFLNGTQEGSTYADTLDYVNGSGNYDRPTFGRFGDTTNINFTGYLDEIRITRGVARYTSNFTAPNSFYPTK